MAPQSQKWTEENTGVAGTGPDQVKLEPNPTEWLNGI